MDHPAAGAYRIAPHNLTPRRMMARAGQAAVERHQMDTKLTDGVMARLTQRQQGTEPRVTSYTLGEPLPYTGKHRQHGAEQQDTLGFTAYPERTAAPPATWNRVGAQDYKRPNLTRLDSVAHQVRCQQVLR
mmetsp:Transcript_32349/g.70807  ORF Transcript_32349/g.70807 Transcript_32349/m.70807 type:complete len:131 (+) Transcript_32349:39-431(+)